MKTVSVHIVTYNSDRDIERCLQAVFRQRYPIQEIIVIDNCSRDQTRTLLSKYQSRIRVIFNEKNKGFAGGHNQAMRLTASDYCLVLNPDVVLHPDYVYFLMDFAAKHEGDFPLGSLTGKLLRTTDSCIVDSCGITMNRSRRAFDIGSGGLSDDWSGGKEVFGVSGAAALYNMEMVKDMTYHDEFFDEDFFAYKEDVDVAWRARIFGWKSYFVPEAVAYHERGWKEGERKSQPLFVRRLSYINRYKMIMKNDRFVYLFRHLIPFLTYEVLSFGYVLLREPELLPTWLDLIKKLPELLRKRRWIMSRSGNDFHRLYLFFNK